MPLGWITAFNISGVEHRSGPPKESLLASRFADANLVDAYAVRLPRGEHHIDALADRMLGHPGVLFRTAMRLRDTAVSGFGLKTSKQVRERLCRDSADHIDFFPVLSRSPSEIVLGEDDRHLDFRLSLLMRSIQGGRSELIATTVVSCHGALGRAYLGTIMIGHVIVVRSALAKAAVIGSRSGENMLITQKRDALR